MSRVITEFSEDDSTPYQRAIRTLVQRINYERVGHPDYCDANYRLDRMRKLLFHLRDPHLAAPVIHIAGTKGKGSTATLLAQMLTASGYRTGLYTSPHLVRLEERFRIDNRPCDEANFVHLVTETQLAADRVEAEGNGPATYFEMTTAIAMLHFAQQNVQAVVLEVGLGGRLDSTNVCQPIVSLITSIGLDHQAQLGSTIAAIAGEKAGIIKRSVPVVTSSRHPEARRVIEATARALSAPLRSLTRDFDCTWRPLLGLPAVNGDTQQEQATSQCEFIPRYDNSHLGHSTWSLALLGAHQGDNLAAALAAIDILAESGWKLSLPVLAAAVARTTVPARLQTVGQRPYRLIDTAHNPDSIAATLNALDEHFPNRPVTIVLATSRDKDIEGMLRLICGRCQRLIVTQYHNNPRGLPVDELLCLANRIVAAPGSPDAALPTLISGEKTTSDAWQRAMQLASADDVICATGSFFQAAELLGLQ